MDRGNHAVSFGYEPPTSGTKGTLVYYDSFEHTTDAELELACDQAVKRSFAKLVLYPLHELTVKRMSKEPISALYKREDKLYEWKRNREAELITVDRLEGKRKKYTPLDSALRHFAETYPAPLFLLLTPEMANAFASFTSFEPWISKVRLLLTEEPAPGSEHPNLLKHRNRWDVIAPL